MENKISEQTLKEEWQSLSIDIKKSIFKGIDKFKEEISKHSNKCFGFQTNYDKDQEMLNFYNHFEVILE